MSLAWYLDDEPLTGGWKPEVLTCAGGVSACNEEKKRRWDGGRRQLEESCSSVPATELVLLGALHAPWPPAPKSQLAATLQQLSAVL
jgi:hypothetical protein